MKETKYTLLQDKLAPLTNETLLALEFEKVFSSQEESGDKAFNYWVYDLKNDGIYSQSLISDADIDLVDGKYTVCLFGCNNLGICKTVGDVEDLIRVLKK